MLQLFCVKVDQVTYIALKIGVVFSQIQSELQLVNRANTWEHGFSIAKFHSLLCYVPDSIPYPPFTAGNSILHVVTQQKYLGLF